MKIRTAFAALLFAAAPTLAQAQSVSYDYVELGYHSYDQDGSDLDIYGYSLDLSAQIKSYLFFQAGYTYGRTEHFVLDSERGYFESNFAYAGLGGFWTAVKRNGDFDGLDVIGTADFIYADATGAGGFPEGGEYDHGYRLGVAARASFRSRIEAEPGLRYSDIFDDETTEYYIQLRGRVHGPIWLVAGYTHSDEDEDVDAWNAGARIYF